MAKTETVELDETTATTLKKRAAAEGLSVPELIASMTALQSRPVVLSSDDLAALDQQWAEVKAGAATVPHEQVARWLETWGTPAFRPWREQ